MNIVINPNLSILPLIDYRTLVELQGNLKELPKAEYEKLRKGLEEKGLLCPFMLWIDPETNKPIIVDGHQRKKIFMLEKITPYDVPYLLVPGSTIDEAKENLLLISSQYGKLTEQGYNEFIIDLPKEWIEQTVSFDALTKQFAETLDHAPTLSKMPEDVELKGFNKTHILISFPPDKLLKIQDHLNAIKEVQGIEFEMGSN
jgi:hypothetical protein